jgi:hypothetical protein
LTFSQTSERPPQSGAEVMAVAGDEPHAEAVTASDNPEAIVFDFVESAVLGISHALSHLTALARISKILFN